MSDNSEILQNNADVSSPAIESQEQDTVESVNEVPPATPTDNIPESNHQAASLDRPQPVLFSTEISVSQRRTSSVQPPVHNTESVVSSAPFLANVEPLLDTANAPSEEVVAADRVCTDEPLDQTAIEDYERSMRSSYDEPIRIELGNEDEINEAIEKIKPGSKASTSRNTLVRESVSDSKIFSEVIEYEEEFLLTENMVNSYTFSDESKSTDVSSDSPAPVEQKTTDDTQPTEQKSSDEESKITEDETKCSENEKTSHKKISEEENKSEEERHQPDNEPKTFSFQNDSNIDNELQAELQATEVDNEELNESLHEDFLLNVSGELDSDEPVSALDQSSQPTDIKIENSQTEPAHSDEAVKTTVQQTNNVSTENSSSAKKLSSTEEDCVTNRRIEDSLEIPKTEVFEKVTEDGDDDPFKKGKKDEKQSKKEPSSNRNNADKKSTNPIDDIDKQEHLPNSSRCSMDWETEKITTSHSAVHESMSKNSEHESNDAEQELQKNEFQVVKRAHEKENEDNKPEKIAKTTIEENKETLKDFNDENSIGQELANTLDQKSEDKLTGSEEDDGDSGDAPGLMGDSLGLLSECGEVEREGEGDNEEERDDANNDDEESNQMAQDSSEVESNGAINEDQEIDPSDVDITNQSELDSIHQSERDAAQDRDIDESLENIARVIMQNDDSAEINLDDPDNGALVADDKDSLLNKQDKEIKSSVNSKVVGETGEFLPEPLPEPKDSASAEEKKLQKEKTPEKVTTVTASQASPPQAAESSKCEKSRSDAGDTPSKTKKLQVMKVNNVVNIVDLEESSSDSDVQETKPRESEAGSAPLEERVTVNLPADIDIVSASRGPTSRITCGNGESIIQDLPKPAPPHKSTPRINTSEITIKTQKVQDETITIADEGDEPKETKPVDKTEKKAPKFSLEVFSVDSDEEDAGKSQGPKKLSAIELQKALDSKKCINYLCESGSNDYIAAPSHVLSYYEVKRSRRYTPLVCRVCRDKVTARAQGLMEGLSRGQPLLSLDMEKACQELVEISDSESDSDGETGASDDDALDAAAINLLEEQLATVLNETWSRCGVARQLGECERELLEQLDRVQKGCEEVDRLLAEEQRTTDQIRSDLYATFASEVKTLPPLEIYDAPLPINPTPPLTPHSESSDQSDTESRRSKRPRRNVKYNGTSTSQNDSNSLCNKQSTNAARDSDSPVIMSVKLGHKAGDDSADVAVVKLSAESAPPDLPPPGELVRTPLSVGSLVWAVRQSHVGSWCLAKLLEMWLPGTMQGKESHLTHMKIRFEYKMKGPSVRQLTGKGIAYQDPSPIRLTIGTRVIALFKPTTGLMKQSFYSGIIAEMPTPVNSFRYLVFFDDGYAQYVSHSGVRVVYESSPRVWEDVHPDSREFVRKYLLNYPERPMVRLQEGQALKTEWNGKWWVSRVVRVDASLAQVQFETDGRLEWIYRGSTRLAPLYLHLQASDRNKRGLTRQHRPYVANKVNAPYVEYTRPEEQDNTSKAAEPTGRREEESRRTVQQRAVAKKSTGAVAVPSQPAPRAAPLKPHEDLMTRVVYYSPKCAVRPHKMVPHTCSPACRRADVLPLKELKTYNPLTRPLLTGWERQILRFKGKKVVMYRAPCGRRVRDPGELHRYLRAVQSDCGVDLFDFNPATHCLAEFVINTCYVHKKDLSHGKENVPVPCVNYYDHSLPEFCLYNTERTPTSGVPLNLDPDFLCGCDCTDDCQDKSKCACWKLTLEGARTIGLEGEGVGYHYKRLPEPLPSGIYECNSRCKCKSTCLNRVAQHPLQLKLQVFKTNNRGWGIRALNDIPKGAFLCVYAGNLLTDATANLDGINEGDEYLAELDYIEVVERMKEDYESDVPAEDKELDEQEKSESESEEEEEIDSGKEETDSEFRHYGLPNQQFSKSLRKRKSKEKPKEDAEEAEKAKSKEPEKEIKTEIEGEGEKKKEKEKEKDKTDQGESCITISDDEEVREPSRFTAQTGLDDDYVPRHRSVRSLYGLDEKCYIVDAKVQGNIGRYLNHSCSPNVFVQNVFVDTHDPRFPWVAFFALSHIHAGHELTWNYNYDIGSVPDKVMYCKCGTANCRGRLL